MQHVWDVLVIVALIWAVVYLRRCRNGDANGPASLPSRRESELETEVVELRKRVAVLERIATDERKSRDISAQIEALRD